MNIEIIQGDDTAKPHCPLCQGHPGHGPAVPIECLDIWSPLPKGTCAPCRHIIEEAQQKERRTRARHRMTVAALISVGTMLLWLGILALLPLL